MIDLNCTRSQFVAACRLVNTTMPYYRWDWDMFNPRVGNTDKRDREAVLDKGVRLVKKNFNELGLAVFVSVPIVDRNRAVKDIVHIAPPNSPLDTFIKDKENENFMNKLEKAIKDTQRWTLELWDLKDKDELDDKEMFNTKTGIARDIIEDEYNTNDTVVKPEKPVFALTTDEMAVYFGSLLKNLYKLEGVEKFKLWSKKNKDGTIDVKKRATGLKIYDEKAEEILPRDSYIGRGSGGPNIGRRMKIVSAYLLSQFDIDHNKHAKSIPEHYCDVVVDFNNFDQLLFNKSLKSIVNKYETHKENPIIMDPEFVKEEEHVEEIDLLDSERDDPNAVFREELTDANVESDKTLDIIPFHSVTESKGDKRKTNQEPNFRKDKEHLESEERTVKTISKPKQKKRRRYESSDSSESSSSESDSEEEVKPSKKRSKRKRSSKQESQFFQKTFIKMMRKTMKSMLNIHQIK